MNSIIIGTAGHVDHGKTTLIRNLTGTDTDRLKEEKERQLTIDLGYAFLNEHIAFIDVPGHEKFIKNMVAGASTIDFVLLVIAADDGIMPQTMEHFQILNLLGIRQGAIILTKCDLVNGKQIESRKKEIKRYFTGSFLENCRILEVAKNNPRQIEIIKDFLLELPNKIIASINNTGFKMPIDRVFTLKGYGTVITGTVVSGSYKKDNKNLLIYPEKLPVALRSIQTQHRTVKKISAGQRCAINLQSKNKLYRGQIVADKNIVAPTKLLTCAFSGVNNSIRITYGEKVRFYINTTEHIAQIRIIGNDKITTSENVIVQFELDRPLSAGFQDKYIIRKLSPKITLGGGIVLNINSQKIRKSDTAAAALYKKLLCDDLNSIIPLFLKIYKYLDKKSLACKLSRPMSTLKPILDKLVQNKKIIIAGEYLLSYKNFLNHKDKILDIIHSDGLFKGKKKGEILKEYNIDTDVINELLTLLINERTLDQKDDFLLVANDNNDNFKETNATRLIKKTLLNTGFKLQNYAQLQKTIPIEKSEFQELINYMKAYEQIMVLQKGYLIHTDQLARAGDLFKNYLTKNNRATVSELKNLLNTTRRYILPILNYFDGDILIRQGDFRILKKINTGPVGLSGRADQRKNKEQSENSEGAQ